MSQNVDWKKIKELKDALDKVVFIGRGYNIDHPFGTRFDNVKVDGRFRRKKNEQKR